MYISVTPTLCIKDLTFSARKLTHMRQNGLIYSSGRVALRAALRFAGIEKGEMVSIPAYICDVVPESLRRAGYEVFYYEMRRDLRISRAELAEEIPERTRALLVVHYFGFPQENIARIAAFAASRRIMLVEDCAHALPDGHAGAGMGRVGHAAIFSLWKSLPVPDGGVLVMKDASALKKASPPVKGPSGVPSLVRLSISHLAEVVGVPPEKAIKLWGELSGRDRQHREGTGIEAGAALSRGPTWATRLLFPHLNLERVFDRRRRNYRLFLSNVGELREAAFREDLVEGACPWATPLLVNNRDFLLTALGRLGIAASPWPRLPVEVNEKDHPEATFLAKHVLLLPVHQNIPARVMSTMATVVRRTLQGFTLRWDRWDYSAPESEALDESV